MNVWEELLRVVRRATGRAIAVPRGPTWSAVDRGAEGVALVVELDAAALGINLQKNLPSTPFFALCIAWWYENATGRPTTVEIRLAGERPGAGPTLSHWRRAQFLLGEVARALGPRFTVTPDPGWEWPSQPVLNAPLIARSDTHAHPPLSEHALEVQIAGSAALLASFPVPLAGLWRQLPVGLFDGRVADETAWTPGGSSQVDLWGMSVDGRVAHLIELKTHDNAHVGILPEALYYARLLHHLRTGRIAGGAPALAAVRAAERIVMWLAAPAYHPLIFLGGRSPLGWLNVGMAADGVELRILPIELDEVGCRRWRAEDGWAGEG